MYQGRDVRDGGARRPLVQHRDPVAGSLRYHLGLVTPTHPGGCRIVVDSIPYSWRDGEDSLFDETYIHYAENTTDQTRILFCDVERAAHARDAGREPLGEPPHHQGKRHRERSGRAGRCVQ